MYVDLYGLPNRGEVGVWSWFEEVIAVGFNHIVSLGNKENYQYTVRREPIAKSGKITQADNVNCRRRLSRKAQFLK